MDKAHNALIPGKPIFNQGWLNNPGVSKAVPIYNSDNAGPKIRALKSGT